MNLFETVDDAVAGCLILADRFGGGGVGIDITVCERIDSDERVFNFAGAGQVQINLSGIETLCQNRRYSGSVKAWKIQDSERQTLNGADVLNVAFLLFITERNNLFAHLTIGMCARK